MNNPIKLEPNGGISFVDLPRSINNNNQEDVVVTFDGTDHIKFICLNCLKEFEVNFRIDNYAMHIDLKCIQCYHNQGTKYRKITIARQDKVEIIVNDSNKKRKNTSLFVKGGQSI